MRLTSGFLLFAWLYLSVCRCELSFPKKEKLTSKIIIDRLFKDGQSKFKYPFRVLFLSDDAYSEPFPQLVISVSKRNFKRAVDRNRIKRLIREAYRFQKEELISLFPSKPSYMAILYTTKEEIASRYYLQKGIIESSFDSDNDIQTAIEVLNSKTKYTSILSGK